jgi:hypothetical protein
MAATRLSPAEALYDEDFFAWTQDQAARLRELKASRRSMPLDLEHLAEEVESLGSERRDAVRSQLRRIIEHCLKLEHSPAREPRRGWRDSIIDARHAIEDRLTPTLRQDIAATLPRLYEQARRKPENGLQVSGERDDARSRPADCPYPLEELLAEDWYPINRHGIVEED